ncbi:hypothetical protein L6452_34133 [Arctium lappa]|uniref:Uncharacterized protein n=1 Tax=Arctium lappa TaxID=4217 RepID=A0ACB8YHE1_ARCLA|nr:hypothetical protein L6452_34133 [Arctium lappa]
MRQRRWLELLKDYDCELLYHPDKANVVANALSRKNYGSEVKVTLTRIGVISSLVEDIKVPKIGRNRELLLAEAHKSKYSIHPGSTKMYRDLKLRYWWSVMKLDVANYVERCVTCLQIKAEHQKLYGSF